MFKNYKKISFGKGLSFYDFDAFAEPVAMNFKGKTKVGSFLGLILTIILAFVLIIYSFIQLIKVFSKDNPNITNQI